MFLIPTEAFRQRRLSEASVLVRPPVQHMAIKHYLRGAATFVPGAMWITQKRTGGSDTALYCYSVWLRHMSLAHEAGLCASAPRLVADFGPGDSIGV